MSKKSPYNVRMRKKPKCFISYAWEGKRHENWVAKLAEALAANGVFVHVDFWETHLGMDISQYMESSVRHSSHVLIVCTPIYAARADRRKGGVGFETSIVTGEIFTRARNKKKFVPILRSGEPRRALPTYLQGTLHVDFRGRSFAGPLKKLLRHIFAERERKRPTLGGPPDLAKPIIPRVTKTRLVKSVSSKAVRVQQKQIKKAMKSQWPRGTAKEAIRIRALSTAAKALKRTSAKKLLKSAAKKI